MLEQIIDKPYCRKMTVLGGKTFRGEVFLEGGLLFLSFAVRSLLMTHKTKLYRKIGVAVGDPRLLFILIEHYL